MSKLDVGYVRVSTLKESQKDSPEHQEAFIRETAGREGTEIDEIYEDRDTATNIIDREDVKRMIENAKRGKIRSIWFVSLSRFSRDAIDALTLKRILVNALKIRVVSIEDGYDSAKKDDELLFGIRSVVNQNTSSDIGGASRRGIRQAALDSGNYIGTIPPFGYRKLVVDDPRTKSGKRKTLVIHEEQAPTVKLIFDLYIDHGFGEKMIVNYLNGDNPGNVVYPSYNGEPWSLTTIQAILDNPTYTGYNVHGRYASEVAYNDLTDLMKRSKKLVKRPKEQWEWSKEIWFPVIVPRERWNLAQEIRIERGGGKRGGRRSFVNVFAKMMNCAECGAAMVTMSSITRGKQYRYLMCSRRRRVGEIGCKNGKWIPYYEMRDELISEILERLRQALADLEKRGTGEIEASLPVGGDHDKEKRKLQKRIEDNRKLLFEIRRQNMLGELDAAQYEFEREQYEKEIAEAEQRLSHIEAVEKRSLDTKRLTAEARRALSALTELKNYDDIEKTRVLLRQCVKRITVDADSKIRIETFI